MPLDNLSDFARPGARANCALPSVVLLKAARIQSTLRPVDPARTPAPHAARRAASRGESDFSGGSAGLGRFTLQDRHTRNTTLGICAAPVFSCAQTTRPSCAPLHPAMRSGFRANRDRAPCWACRDSRLCLVRSRFSLSGARLSWERARGAPVFLLLRSVWQHAGGMMNLLPGEWKLRWHIRARRLLARAALVVAMPGRGSCCCCAVAKPNRCAWPDGCLCDRALADNHRRRACQVWWIPGRKLRSAPARGPSPRKVAGEESRAIGASGCRSSSCVFLAVVHSGAARVRGWGWRVRELLPGRARVVLGTEQSWDGRTLARYLARVPRLAADLPSGVDAAPSAHVSVRMTARGAPRAPRAWSAPSPSHSSVGASRAQSYTCPPR